METTAGQVARLICDVYTPDGKPFEGDPRWILKKVIKEAEDMGYVFEVGLNVNSSCSTQMITDCQQHFHTRKLDILI